MAKSETVIEKIKQQKLLPLFYHSQADTCLRVTKALCAAGIGIIEFTNRGPAALANFKELVAWRNQHQPGLLLAAGTIQSAEQAEAFLNAGADFLVSPFFDAGVCAVAAKGKKLWIPGCTTPTEIHHAQQAGSHLIKLFPGNLLGPAFVSGIKDLFPGVDFMPTGGVEIDKTNLAAWFNAGVCAVGMGSKLVSQKLMDAGNYTAIETETRKALELINNLTEKA